MTCFGAGDPEIRPKPLKRDAVGQTRMGDKCFRQNHAACAINAEFARPAQDRKRCGFGEVWIILGKVFCGLG
jgi:hypothetical protein